MRNQKKHMSLLILVLLSATLCLSACGEHTHNFSDWKVTRKATCTEEGKEERECQQCGEFERQSFPAKGHSFSQWELTDKGTCNREGTEQRRCEKCDETEERSVPAVARAATEIHDMYVDSVGEVAVYDKQGNNLGLGSCFVYKDDGTLITNYHVVEDAYSASVTLGEETYNVEKVLAYDKDIDVAVLKISDADIKQVTVCQEDHAVGEVVYAFGSSQGLTATFSDGMITHARREDGGVVYVQHDAPISPGNSGGPLINAYGEVIGINVFTLVDSQNLNFAIHISELENLDYSSPMTMKELYEKESDPYKKLKNHILTAGTYDSETGNYNLTLGEEYSYEYGFNYRWLVYYDAEFDEISFSAMIDSDYCVFLDIDSALSGHYQWWFFYDDYSMYGYLSARSFSNSTTLSYTESDFYTTSDNNSACSIAASMIHLLCITMDSDLADAGVTAEDLGFMNY